MPGPLRALRPALSATGRLLGSIATLALDRVAGTDAEVPYDLGGVTSEWLTGALQERSPGARVRSLRRIDASSGTTTRARIAVDYADPGDAGVLPETLFVKLQPGAWPQRVFVHATGLGDSEVRFYREIRPAVPLRVPEVVLARSQAAGRRFALLLEDLAAGGCRFTRVGGPVDVETAEAVLTELARLHAAFWESPRLRGDLAWLSSPADRGRDADWQRAVSRLLVRAAQRRFSRAMPGAFSRACDLLCERREALDALWADGPHTLLHGDPHVGNLFFDADRVGFLDWQVLTRAPGPRDATYFLCSSLPTALRRAHGERLLGRYRAALAEAGGPELSEQDLWTRHRLFALYAFLATAFTAAAGSGLQAEGIARAAMEAATDAIVELNSVELAESLL